MNIKTAIEPQAAVISIGGRLTASSAPLLRAEIHSLVGAGSNRIVVDLEAAEFVDSSGLGALVGGLKSARQAGGDLRIAAVPANVQTVLRLTNLDRVLHIHPTVSEALGE